MKSLIIAFAMYSKLPMPRTEWERGSLAWALCWLPLVGAVIGGALRLWLWCWGALGLAALGAAGAAALPVLLSGGIHMDGFCDTCDALSSHQSRERKLEILKDSHAGAFAILCCCLYFLALYAAWREVNLTPGARWVLALGPVLSRCLAALAAVWWRNARGNGLLAAFTAPMDRRRARAVLLLLLAAVLGAMAALSLAFREPPLLAVPAAALAVFGYYRRAAYGQFGGITGDTEGFFLQLCECAMVLALALAQKIGGAWL